jgi:hypothetical protein
VIHNSASVAVAISEEEFVQGVLNALPGYRTLDNDMVDADDVRASTTVVVTSYETIVSNMAHLPGNGAHEYAPGTGNLAALEFGLQQAACMADGEHLSADHCTVQVLSLTRRRLQAGSGVNVEFEVTADVDVHDACSPDALAGAFVEAVQSDECPSPALSALTVDDLGIEEPEVSTSIEYSVVTTDATSASSAARAMNDPGVMAAGLASALPVGRIPAGQTLEVDAGRATGQAAPRPPAPSVANGGASTMAADEEGGSGWVILVVLFLFILAGGGAGGFFFWQNQNRIKTEMVKKGSFSNPMMDGDPDEEDPDEEDPDEDGLD